MLKIDYLIQEHAKNPREFEEICLVLRALNFHEALFERCARLESLLEILYGHNEVYESIYDLLSKTTSTEMFHWHSFLNMLLNYCEDRYAVIVLDALNEKFEKNSTKSQAEFKEFLAVKMLLIQEINYAAKKVDISKINFFRNMKFLPLYEKLAAQGNKLVMVSLGQIFQEGIGLIAANVEQARTLFKQAVELNDVRAMNCLAFLYENKFSKEYDLSKAYALYEKAASCGNSLAMINLANLLLKDGRGIASQVHQRVVLLYQKACFLQNTFAIHSIISLCHQAFYMQMSNEELLSLYNCAIKSGDFEGVKPYSNHLFNLASNLSLKSSAYDYSYLVSLIEFWVDNLSEPYSWSIIQCSELALQNMLRFLSLMLYEEKIGRLKSTIISNYIRELTSQVTSSSELVTANSKLKNYYEDLSLINKASNLTFEDKVNKILYKAHEFSQAKLTDLRAITEFILRELPISGFPQIVLYEKLLLVLIKKLIKNSEEDKLKSINIDNLFMLFLDRRDKMKIQGEFAAHPFIYDNEYGYMCAMLRAFMFCTILYTRFRNSSLEDKYLFLSENWVEILQCLHRLATDGVLKPKPNSKVDVNSEAHKEVIPGVTKDEFAKELSNKIQTLLNELMIIPSYYFEVANLNASVIIRRNFTLLPPDADKKFMEQVCSKVLFLEGATKLDPFKIWKACGYLSLIHPFNDGNGRVFGFLLPLFLCMLYDLDLFMKQSCYTLEYIPDSLIMRHYKDAVAKYKQVILNQEFRISAQNLKGINFAEVDLSVD